MEDKEKVVGSVNLEVPVVPELFTFSTGSIVKTPKGIGRVQEIKDFGTGSILVELKMLDGSDAGKVIAIKISEIMGVVITSRGPKIENR